MHDLVTEESFDLEKTYEYILSIQVSLDGFSFSILSPSTKKIVASKRTQLKISSSSLISRRFNDWVESEELLQKSFKKVHIIVFSKKFTLIPEKYFHDTLKREIPQFLFEGNNDSEIAENSIEKIKTRLLFALPAGLNDVILKQIGECEIAHPVKIVLNNLPEKEKENGLILLFDAKCFYIILFNKNKILLANNFRMAHANDVVYYVLTTLKQLEISTSETDLFIIETINKLQGVEDFLQPYFLEIKKLELAEFQLL